MREKAFIVFAIVTLIAICYFVSVTLAKTKYLEKKEVTKTMLKWNKALGVKCSFCHTSNRSETYKNLAGKTVNEEELKALVHQRIARAMLGYMLYMNKKENQNYTCDTCHQGEKDVEVHQ